MNSGNAYSAVELQPQIMMAQFYRKGKENHQLPCHLLQKTKLFQIRTLPAQAKTCSVAAAWAARRRGNWRGGIGLLGGSVKLLAEKKHNRTMVSQKVGQNLRCEGETGFHGMKAGE